MAAESLPAGGCVDTPGRSGLLAGAAATNRSVRLGSLTGYKAWGKRDAIAAVQDLRSLNPIWSVVTSSIEAMTLMEDDSAGCSWKSR